MMWLTLLTAAIAPTFWFWAVVEDERRRHRTRHQQARTRTIANRSGRVWP